MRLLMVSTIGSRKDGLYVRPYNIAKYFAELQFDFQLAAFGKPPVGLSPLQVTTLPQSYYASFKRIPSVALLSAYLAQAIVKSRRNIVYAHQLPNILSSWGGALMAGVSLPIVGDLHGLPSLEMRSWGSALQASIDQLLEGALANMCRGLIAASEGIKAELVRRGLSSSKVHVVPNGIDPREFYPLRRRDEVRKGLSLPLNKRIVAFTAPRSFTPNVMAIKHLYGAASLLEKRSSNFLFVIIGGGEVVEGKPGNVIYTGYVDDLNSYLNACDVAVAPYPPLAVCGGARNKILEYWACGLPVVSTAEGTRGLSSAHQRLPVILTGYDRESLADHIEQVASNPDQSRDLGERGRSLVLSEFNWESQVLRLHDILQSYTSG
jgi:glycosyltransferase involved in cell wall biosynthesis